MAEPRKIFRIEETAVATYGRRGDGSQASHRHAEIMQALGALSTALAAPVVETRPERPTTAQASSDAATERLACELNLIADAIGGSDGDAAGSGDAALQGEHLTRIAHELEAVTSGTAQATQKILAAAEEIDQLANTLAAGLKGKLEQNLAQDISDLVIRIFEACNFQDLTGQRVAKALATLKFVEQHVSHALDEIKTAMQARPPVDSMQYLHGPRLDSDSGHISQSEIDALFGS
jgi:chemotaxis protein CheZ